MEIIDNAKQEIEKIYIIQPILRTDYQALAAVDESLIECDGALFAVV